jgi:hypothetical protein
LRAWINERTRFVKLRIEDAVTAFKAGAPWAEAELRRTTNTCLQLSDAHKALGALTIGGPDRD